MFFLVKCEFYLEGSVGHGSSLVFKVYSNSPVLYLPLLETVSITISRILMFRITGEADLCIAYHYLRVSICCSYHYLLLALSSTVVVVAIPV